MFFHTMYNIIDSFYAGRISTLALAALGLSFPVYLLIIATSSGLSRGSSALIANAIGAGDEKNQTRYIEQAISMAIVIGIVVTIVGVLAARPLFEILGAEGEYLSIALQYMIPIFLGAIFFVLNSVSNAILVAHGDSRTFSKVLIVGFFANLILDPWFLYGGFGLPAMGVAGIAWATVVIQIASSIFMLSTVVRRELFSWQPWQNLIPDPRIFREIAVQALPASFATMSVAIGFFVITYFLKTYGEPSVAAFGVTTRIEQLGLLPTMGLYAAIMALVGQNNGAGNFERVKETMRVCNWIGIALNLTTSIIIFIFSRQLMRVFTPDEEVVQLGVNCLNIIVPIQWSYVMTSTHLAMLQAIKRPFYGFFESVLRRVLLPLPFFWIFIWTYQSGVDSVWYTFAGTNVFMTIVTIFYARTVLKEITSVDSNMPE